MVRFYFGKVLWSDLCKGLIHVDAPAQVTCHYCKEGFVEGDNGLQLQCENVFHQECLQRMVIGSVGHQRQKCPCFGGTEQDPPGMSKRNAAKAAVVEYLRQRYLAEVLTDG